jgi:hypothetical protein
MTPTSENHSPTPLHEPINAEIDATVDGVSACFSASAHFHN